MASDQFKAAKEIHWINPSGRRMLLSPGNTPGSSLEACVDHGAIEIRGKECLLISFGTSPGSPGIETIYESIHITVSIAHCQITWKDE
jgi:hypothetical protein